MRGYLKEMVRVLLLLVLVLFSFQFVEARPVPAHPSGSSHSAVARQVPQRPPARAVPPARQHRQVELAQPPQQDQAADQSQTDADMQKQLSDLQHQFEQEALNRMRYGRPSYGFGGFMNDVVPFFVFIGVTLALLWILRTVLDNRRWYRMVKVQTETHAKLLDRFASSQEMLAYMQSDAGRKFLEAPVFDDQRRQVSTLPFGRILWSVQVGIIAAILGAGILFLRGKVSPDADMGLQIFGTLTLTLGIGFLVSGGVSYVLAKHFGLLERPHALGRSEHNA